MNIINENNSFRYEIVYPLFKKGSTFSNDLVKKCDDHKTSLNHYISKQTINNTDQMNFNQKTTTPTYKLNIVWLNVFIMGSLHLMFIYTFYLMPRGKLLSFVWMWILFIFSITFGIQIAAHRLWFHHSFKASTGLRWFLSMCQVMALQNSIYEWVRDHRAHHKFVDTYADPHNARRGLFFSHVGWLLVKKHLEVKRRGATLDLSDLEAYSVVTFQRRYYITLVLLVWGIIPTIVPLLWGEQLLLSFMFFVPFRYVLSLNLTWCINSWAHTYGNRPYNKNILAIEINIRDLVMGDGFHNYHHTFPWDYSSSEFGPLDVYNPSTALINFFHYMGWAWDLKRAPRSLVKGKVTATGDVNKKLAIYGPGDWRHFWYEWIRGLSVMFALFGTFVAINIFCK